MTNLKPLRKTEPPPAELERDRLLREHREREERAEQAARVAAFFLFED